MTVGGGVFFATDFRFFKNCHFWGTFDQKAKTPVKMIGRFKMISALREYSFLFPFLKRYEGKAIFWGYCLNLLA